MDGIILGNPSHGDAHSDLEDDSSPSRPKWWAMLVGDVHDDELVEGRSSRGKSKKNIVNFALMNNI